jgi:molybdate transport system ATP-binding protein
MIEVRNAHKALGEFSLRGMDLRIESGEYFVILGPTGAGKTVLLECVAGLHRLDEGEVWLDGRNVTKVPTELRHIGYVPQDYVLFPHLDLQRNIGFSLALQRVPTAEIEARTAQLAELLNITHLLERKPRTLSGGEQQRGALARALAPRPTVLLLDEPLSALDEGTRGELAPELSRICRELGTTIVHVCHNFDEAIELGDRVGIMHQGRMLQVGPPAEVLRRPDTDFIARFVGARNVFPITALDRAQKRVTVGEALTLTVAALPEGADLLAMIRPEEISVSRGGEGLACVLRQVEDRGRHMRLHLEGPLPLMAILTPQAYRQSGVQAGEAVMARWDAEAVHVMVR